MTFKLKSNNDLWDSLVKEKFELYKKMIKLSDFILNSKYESLDLETKQLLNQQYKIMVDYHQILGKRILLIKI